MNNSKLSLHDIAKIEIEEAEDHEGTQWRHVVFTSSDGSVFTITAFPARPTVEVIPVSFSRKLEEEKQS